MRQVDHLIAGGTGSAGGGRVHQVWNPSTGEVQAEVALGDAALLERAVAAARAVQPGWAMTNPQKRARVMFAFKQLVEKAGTACVYDRPPRCRPCALPPHVDYGRVRGKRVTSRPLSR